MSILEKLVTTLRQNQGLQQSAAMVLGTGLGAGMSALAIILFSRLLGPVEFGYFSVILAITVILSKFLDAGLNAATVKFVGQSTALKQKIMVLSTVTHLKILLSIFLLLLSPFLAWFLNSFLQFDNLFLIWLGIILSLATVWYEHFQFAVQAFHQFGTSLILNAVQAGWKLLLAVCLLLLGSANLIVSSVGFLIGPAAALVVVPFLFKKVGQISLSTISKKNKKRIVNFTKHSSVMIITAGLIEQVDILLVEMFLNDFEVGIFAGASRLAMVILLFAYALASVLNARVARYSDPTVMTEYLKKAAKVVIFVGLLAIPAGLLAPFFLQFLLGAAYSTGGEVVTLLVLGAMLLLATIPLIACFYSLDEDWYFSVSGVFQLTVLVGLNVWLLPQLGLLGAAWARFITRVVLFGFTVVSLIWILRKKGYFKTAR